MIDYKLRTKSLELDRLNDELAGLRRVVAAAKRVDNAARAYGVVRARRDPELEPSPDTNLGKFYSAIYKLSAEIQRLK